MVIEESIEILAQPADVFAVYADVARWHLWDPDTRWASIDGPFRTGARGRLKPSMGFAVPMKFVSVVEDRSFVVESPALLCTLRFEHDLLPSPAGVLAMHRVSFSGPLAGFFGRLVGARVRVGLPVTMSNLKRTVEDARRSARSAPADAPAANMQA